MTPKPVERLMMRFFRATPTIFDDAVVEVLNLMANDSLSRFQRHPLFAIKWRTFRQQRKQLNMFDSVEKLEDRGARNSARSNRSSQEKNLQTSARGSPQSAIGDLSKIVPATVLSPSAETPIKTSTPRSPSRTPRSTSRVEATSGPPRRHRPSSLVDADQAAAHQSTATEEEGTEKN